MSSLGNFAELPMNVGMDPAQADSIPQPNLHHTGESSGSGSGALVPVSFPPIPSYLANLVQAVGTLATTQQAFQQNIETLYLSKRVSATIGSSCRC